MAGHLPQHVASPPLEITRLRVSGFKSFSEPVELQLEAGLTGVVGPNGCGKSNIVEALRWAMGESSAKGLRGDEMEDVIFNGSATRPAHDVAEVRLKLRGRPEGLAGFAEEGELEVARRIGRGIGSTYRINGREARARDVQILFADAGAGSRSPAIISQGQIGFIVDSQGRPSGASCSRTRPASAACRRAGARPSCGWRRPGQPAAGARPAGHPGDPAGRAGQAGPAGAALPPARGRAAHHRGPAASSAPCRGRRAGPRPPTSWRRWPKGEQVQEAAARRRRATGRGGWRGLPALREAAAALRPRPAALRERLAGLREAAGREAAHLAALTRQRDEADAGSASGPSAASRAGRGIARRRRRRRGRWEPRGEGRGGPWPRRDRRE